MALILEHVIVLGLPGASERVAQELDDDVTCKPAFAGFTVEVVEFDT
jgi:hypothetical protein